MTTDAAIVKCRRKDYDEAPFFFLEPKGETPYAVCWPGLDPDRIRSTAEALLAEWPEKLEAHFEAPVHPERVEGLAELGMEPSVTAAVIELVAAETGARALLLPDGFELTPVEFSDLLHPRKNGATRYTTWLGEALCADLSAHPAPAWPPAPH